MKTNYSEILPTAMLPHTLGTREDRINFMKMEQETRSRSIALEGTIHCNGDKDMVDLCRVRRGASGVTNAE